MDIVITIFSIVGIIIIYLADRRAQFYKKFYRNVKPGDKIKFYIGEEKYHGILIDIVNEKRKMAKVQDDMGSGPVIIPFEDIHPTTGGNYNKISIN